MPRDFEQIAAAAAYINNAQTADETTSLPPGYISGFYVTLKQDYTVTISAGTAYVAGRAVKMETEHLLAGSDWVVPRLDTPQHYYIYLDKSGAIHVDLVQPKFNSGYGYYEQPDYGWRAIGKIFVKSNDIIYAVRQVEKSGSTVTVAPAGFTGEADYYCTGTADDILINAAILYAYTAYYGGTVQLLAGEFTISNTVELLSNISMIGGGGSTRILGNGSLVRSVGLIGAHLSNITVSNLRTVNCGISFTYTDGIIVSDIFSDCDYGVAVGLSTCTDFAVSRIISNGTGSSISNTGILSFSACSNGSVSNCTISNIACSSGVSGITVLGGSSIIISNNSLTSFVNSGAGGSVWGIYLFLSHRCIISDNRITDLSNTVTASDVIGIYILGASNYNKVTGNMCYNNGSDVGIENINGDHYYDEGNGTQVYSNSWQSPVVAEPSVGELHPHNAIVISGDDPSLSGWYGTINLAAEVPVGAKTIFCRLEYRTPTVGRWVILADTSARAGAFELVQYSQVANAFTDTHGFVTLSPTRTFDWYVSNPDIDDVTVQIQGYTS